MVDLPDRITSTLQSYRDEVLRWNASFGLVSRVDTANRVTDLIEESVSSYKTLTESVLPAVASSSLDLVAALHYLDLGSGAGIPGLIWHLLAGELGFGGSKHMGSTLVEPRHKRAWFLERAAEIMGLRELRVGEDQWGQRTALSGDSLPERLTGMISLKALHLTDDDIIAGWRRYRRSAEAADDSLIICRLHGQPDSLDEELRDKLHLPDAGPGGDAGTPWVCLFPVGDSSRPWSLLVSIYPRL